MPRLTIDDREIEVPAGTKVIEAAERLGIMIPRFCYHEALGSVGACRMCAVKFVEGPVKGLQMSCMVDAQDGMVVSTADAEAVEFRRFIIECLMLNHPHDCPVCDEGGQCLLQDETVSGGHGLRRYQGRKRTYNDQYLGELIAHEMNRCIHCYRCSRFYQEYAGYRDLGPLQIACRVFFGRFEDGPLESPFSGNLVDICPTGVYTDKPSRCKARRWDLQRAPSICVHCSLGCSTMANARYREVIRIEARFNHKVNGHFICDRGRFGFPYTNLQVRPRTARTLDGETSLRSAITVAAEKLREIIRHGGPGAVACLGSSRSSLETQSMLKRLCRLQGWEMPNFFVDSNLEEKVRSAVSILDESTAVTLKDVEYADFIVAAGVDAINEAPMLALAMRQAARREGKVVVIDPRPVFLPLPFIHIPVAPDLIEACLQRIFSFVGGEGRANPGQNQEYSSWLPKENALPSEIAEILDSLAEKLGFARNPVVICGTDIVRGSTPSVAASLARRLQKAQGRGGLLYVLPGANAFGAGLLSPLHCRPFSHVLESIEEGRIRALIVAEADPLHDFLHRKRMEAALANLDLLLVLDCLDSETVRKAHVFLPTTTHFETGSSFINHEGRLQYAEPVHHGGIPIGQAGGGSHPPRIYRGDIPGDVPKAAWIILAELARMLSTPNLEILGVGPWSLIGEELPVLKKLEKVSFPPEGVRILPDEMEVGTLPASESEAHSWSEPSVCPRDALELLLADWTFGTEELSSYSGPLQRVERQPCAFMHVEDAVRVGCSNGDRVVIGLEGGEIDVTLSATDRMGRGVLILPRHRQVDWRKIPEAPCFVTFYGIRKESSVESSGDVAVCRKSEA